jgi:glycosyltransferase involved in cell wall biosynthesis
MHKTVALVPAYNEGPRLASVLEIILSSPLVEETIVIDDGSADNTADVAGHYPVKLLGWKQNRGKGAALQAGLEEAHDAATFLFLDADLINLKHEHIEALLDPLAHTEQASMTIGVFRAGNKKSVNLAQHYFSILNGQRALKREFVDILPDLGWSRFGVEILLTKYAELAGETVLYPELQGITHVTKEEKLGFWNGFRYRLQMYHECLYSLFHHRKMICRYPGRVPGKILEKVEGGR